MFSYSTGYYFSPPDDQYLKFKNRCSLLYSFSKFVHGSSNTQGVKRAIVYSTVADTVYFSYTYISVSIIGFKHIWEYETCKYPIQLAFFNEPRMACVLLIFLKEIVSPMFRNCKLIFILLAKIWKCLFLKNFFDPQFL